MTITVTVPVSGTAKRNIIQMAREFCSLSGFEFEGTPEEDSSHLRELDAMMAEEPWDTLGYDPATYGSGRPEDPSGLAAASISAVSKYLGLRIAPGLAKTIRPEARAALVRSYNLLFAQVATIPSMPMRNQPRGSGQTWFGPWWPFIDDDPVT